MENVIYIVIAIVAAGIGGYMLYLNFQTKKARKTQLAEFNTRYSGKLLGENYQRAMGYGAILACYRGEQILSLIPKEPTDVYRQGMNKQWEIVDEQSAVNAINGLLSLQRSQQYDEFIRTRQTNKDLNKIYVRIAQELNLPEEDVRAIQSTYAWDIGRAVSVAKWCFWIGYLTEEQFYRCLDQCINIVLQRGRDWTEYTCSFLLGRCIHGFKLDDVISAAQSLFSPSENMKKKDSDITIYQDVTFK